MIWYVITKSGKRRIFMKKDKEIAIRVFEEEGVEFGWRQNDLYAKYIPLKKR